MALTRAAAQADALVDELATLGADVIALPVIRIAPAPDPDALRRAAQDVRDYDWLCLTSANGVEHFFEALRGEPAAALAGVKVAAVGAATARELARRGRPADLVPDEYSGADLAKALTQSGGAAGRRFLLARAAQADRDLPDALTAAGAQVDEVAAYETLTNGPRCAAGLERLRAEGCDDLVFSSGSTVRAFLDLYGAQAAAALGARWISIGPKTSAVIRERGFSVHAEARSRTMEGVVRALMEAGRGEG